MRHKTKRVVHKHKLTRKRGGSNDTDSDEQEKREMEERQQSALRYAKRFEVQTEKEKKDNFRKLFTTYLTNLKNALTQKSDVKSAIKQLTNWFHNYRQYINTLIPVTSDFLPINKYTYGEQGQQLYSFVPLTAILIHNIGQTSVIKDLVSSFVKNTGNINLKSTTKSITALSEAVSLRNAGLIEYLINLGADNNTLNAQQIVDFNELMTRYQSASAPVAQLEFKPLQIVAPPPNGYEYDVEPEFWKPIFKEGELTKIRQLIQEMMTRDRTIPYIQNELQEMYSICNIVKIMIPSYYVATKIEPKYTNNLFTQESPADFSNYNIILCASMILLGVISQKMIGQQYQPLFKGGKAIQLVLSDVYETEDIDLVIMPADNVEYNKEMVSYVAGHIAYLIQWFLGSASSGMQRQTISVQAPDPNKPKVNQHIYKLSYIKTSAGSGRVEYKQFADIDFKEIPSEVKDFFVKATEFTFDIPEIDETVMFRCPNLASLLDEKIHYVIKYFKYRDLIVQNKKIPDAEYENITLEDCNRFIDKFRKAVLALIAGLYKRRFPELSKEEIDKKALEGLKKRIDKLNK